MSSILSTSEQTRWKMCMEPSAKVGLALISDGESRVRVYTQDRQIVQAGFDAPTVAPTVADAGAGSLTAGYVAYCYCYASSKYPNVEAIETAGGQVWPKSNPSPPSATYSITASHGNLVTVTKSNRLDSDKIFIYRTAIKSTAAEATALGAAGEMFYIGVVEDNAIAGTTTFTDNITAAQEQMELDNYSAPQFWLCVYDDPFWWGIGNPELNVSVTLNGTASIVAAAGSFFSGRNGQLVTFDGVTSGGFDGKGTYYFKYSTDSVANISTDSALSSTSVAPATGTTTMRVRGYAGTLYRSKSRNPFAWGITNYLTSPDGSSVSREPEQYALVVGGRAAAIAAMPEQKLLKIDVENPCACYTLNLTLAGGAQSNFAEGKRTIDRQYTNTAHHAQFVSPFPDGNTNLVGIDASNLALVRATATDQGLFGTEVFRTMQGMITSDNKPRLYHGVYDSLTELSCWWIKTCTDANDLVSIDTCICFHSPSGQWSTFRDFDITASASVYDPTALQTITIIGTASGGIALAFADGVYNNLTENTIVARTFTIVAPAAERDGFEFTGSPVGPTPAAGTYFDIGDTVGPVRVWLNSLANPVSSPAVPARGRLLEVPNAVDNGDLSACAGNVAVVISNDNAFSIVTTSTLGAIWDLNATGLVAPLDTGTVDTDITLVQQIAGTGGVTISSAVIPDPGAWGFFQATTGVSAPYELWMKANALGEFDQTVSLNAATNTIVNSPLGTGTAGVALIGLINCEARSYMQPSQTKPGSARELWASFRNADRAPFFRFQMEFDTAQYGSDITPKQDVRPDGSSSVNWYARNVPTPLVNQMGYRLIQRGYDAFEVLGLDIKNAQT